HPAVYVDHGKLWEGAIHSLHSRWPHIANKLYKIMHVRMHLALAEKDYDKAINCMQASFDIARQTGELLQESNVFVSMHLYQSIQYQIQQPLLDHGEAFHAAHLNRLD